MEEDNGEAIKTGMDMAYEQSILGTFGLMMTEKAKLKVIQELCHKMGIEFNIDKKEFTPRDMKKFKPDCGEN